MTIMNCACFKEYTPPTDIKSALDFYEIVMAEFIEVRKYCHVLQFVLPEDVFKITRFTYQQFDQAQHDSKFFIAFLRNDLRRLTEALHTLLVDCDGNHIKQINPSYISDLKENWMVSKANDEETKVDFLVELRKHQVSRIHNGKLHELIFAHDISKVATIENLEAWDSKSPDILINTQSIRLAIEVKFIGEADIHFEASLMNEATSFSPERAFTYVVVRLCEASAQLRHYNIQAKKVAVIMYDAMSWYHVEIATEKLGFSFNNPDISKHKDMLDYLCKNKSPRKIELIKDIFANPKKHLAGLDGFWILCANAFNYDLKFESGIEFPLKGEGS